MTVISYTSNVPVEDRADLWMAASSEPFAPLECRHHDRASFGSLLSRLYVSPHTIRRTRVLAAEANGDRYRLSLLRDGHAPVVQNGLVPPS
jgi:hypothetical protein